MHAWAEDGADYKAQDLPKDDEEHEMYLEYYRNIGVPEEFYWFTLQAAPYEEMHYMTEEEIRRFKILTQD